MRALVRRNDWPRPGSIVTVSCEPLAVGSTVRRRFLAHMPSNPNSHEDIPMSEAWFDRRTFIAAAGALAALPAVPVATPAADRLPVKDPRATAGDAVEPNWDERLTVTVGP